MWEGRHCCGRAAIALGLPVLRQRPEGRMLGYVDGIRESPILYNESPILYKGISLTL